jgi:glycosyltransferase involved in cell wall biosynthesis
VRPPRVLVVGPSERSAGGVRAVMAALADSPLAGRVRLVEVSTHVDGPLAVKLLAAARGLGRLASALVAAPPDLVYLHMASYGSFWRKAIAAGMTRLARRPYVVHLHGGAFTSFHAGSPAPVRALIRAVLRGAAAVVVLSPAWAVDIEAIAGRTTEIIPNPVRVPERAADPRADPPVIVALGRLGPDKGSYVLLDAFAAIAGRHPSATLVMAGDGETEGVLAAARAAGLADRVSVPGWVGTAEVARLLRTATVFALPSRIEGLPMSMLEAMAHGLPVVVTPVGGIPDVVSDGVDGRLVRPDDPEGLAAAIDALLSDRETAVRLGAAARGRMAEEFEIHVVAERVAAVVERCIARHPAPRAGSTTSV